MCVVYNNVYMGTVNISSKTWHVCGTANITTRHVYNNVYMGTVNISSKTWHVCGVQQCVHGYSQH